MLLVIGVGGGIGKTNRGGLFLNIPTFKKTIDEGKIMLLSFFLYFASAFPMELGATTIILLGSNLGLPISSTQCKVGAIAAVGLFDNISAVDYRIMRDTLLAWIVTLPVSGVLAAGITALLVLFEPLL